MGLLQRAVETYDANHSLIGVYREGHTPLPPVGHILTNANLEITLDRDGSCVSARSVDKSEPKILIPVTEESAGRTKPPAAHPLCDQLKYVAPGKEKEHTLYLNLLQTWAGSDASHPFLPVILTYVWKETILVDLLKFGALRVDDKGKYDEKLLVCWRVLGIENEEPCCWKNLSLLSAFSCFYAERISGRKTGLCMVTGEFVPTAQQHPKGIIPVNGNAKLISANDERGFTYRGRFSEDWQAATVGYIASQKAHCALRWLASEQGVQEYVGGRVFLCWNPQGIRLPPVIRRARCSEETPRYKPTDYQKALQSTLMSYRRDTQLTGRETAVVAAFDAATTGRLALAYYNEFALPLFLVRLQNWDAHCCWYNGKFGIQAPNLLRIVDCAFGTQRIRKDNAVLETDERIQSQHVQRLLHCKLNGGVFPFDIVKALVQRASSPQSYEESIWRGILFTACAAMQKYRYDTRQGGNEMSWTLDEKNRSFQFGRLLATMERAEADYYGKTEERRQTNAIKAMSEFRRKPWEVFERVNRQLENAYVSRIDPWQADRYARAKGEIVAILAQFPKEELNRPLEDIYLMGYELQRNEFFRKKEDAEAASEEE